MKFIIRSLKRVSIFSCFLILFVLIGCKDNNISQGENPEAEKVLKKINVPINKKEIKKEEAEKSPLKKEEKIDKKDKKENFVKKNKELLSKKVIADLIKAEDDIKNDDKYSTTSRSQYSPEGRVNPFNPLIKDSEKKEVSRKKEKENRPKTPLEKLDLSQLKLVAIMGVSDGKFAVLEESSGKGYIVDTGTYVGLNSGQITFIGSDQIIITETVEDISGKSLKRERILKIQKPVGE